jgi:hypothetical protein
MTTTSSTASARSHLKGEHSRWCQKIKGESIYCRFTDQLVGNIRPSEKPEAAR